MNLVILRIYSLIMTRFTKYFILLFSVLLINSCNKEENTPTPIPTTGNLYLKFNHNFNGDTFALNTEYTDDFGNKYTFVRASMYLSQPKLRNSDGNELQPSNQYFLVHSTTEQAFVEAFKPTTITRASINIGLDKEANNSDPAEYDVSHPLAYQSPSMYWGSMMDYLFVVLEGRVDTDKDAVLDESYTFHFGTDAYLNSISKDNISLSIESSKTTYLNVNIDYSKFFSGIDLSTENKMHTAPDEVVLTEKFHQNVTKAVSFE